MQLIFLPTGIARKSFYDSSGIRLFGIKSLRLELNHTTLKQFRISDNGNDQ